MTIKRIKNNQKLIKPEQKDSIEVFSGVIAHEFNNLLSGIQAWAQIGEKEKDQKNIELAFKNINKACKRGTKLAESLLDLSRSQQLNTMDVNINNLIDETLELLMVQFKAKNIIIKKEYNSTESVIIDKGKIYQVLLNLLINAKDAVENEKGCINLSTQQKDNMVEISITDNGKGIPQEHIKDIFTPFYSTKKGDNKDNCSGTGLGLSIAKDIIRQHNGEIVVESIEGKGTTFHIYLPGKF